MERGVDRDPAVHELHRAIQARLTELEELLEEVNGHWTYEDGVYRFYHQSWKVYRLQDATDRIVAALRSVAPDRALDTWFVDIVRSGTGKRFEPELNARWLSETRPVLEAFFHARYFLEMVCKYGRQLDEPPAIMPSGWAAVLCLYDLR